MSAPPKIWTVKIDEKDDGGMWVPWPLDDATPYVPAAALEVAQARIAALEEALANTPAPTHSALHPPR